MDLHLYKIFLIIQIFTVLEDKYEILVKIYNSFLNKCINNMMYIYYNENPMGLQAI